MIVAMETYLPVEDCKCEGRHAERPNYEHMTYVTIPLRRTKNQTFDKAHILLQEGSDPAKGAL
jgi:hypothetical protein